MRAINHALTGSIIGLVSGEPLVALPAALVSHFLLDAIPHHGVKEDVMVWLRTKTFRRLLYVDMLACFVLVLILAIRQPSHWLLAVVCALVAASPDFMSIGLYSRALAHKPRRSSRYASFASTIQWFERPIGAVVEIVWFIGALIIIIPFLD